VSSRRYAVFAVLAAAIVAGAPASADPRWLFAALAKWSPGVVYFVSTEKPWVALTFDDGPDPETTPRILDTLRRHGAHATFFLISERIPGNEAIVSRIVAERHELANHLTRDEPSIELSPEAFERNLLATHSELARYGPVRWFRPGSAWFDREMLTTLEKHEYRIALGSVYSFDPQIPSVWVASRYIEWTVEPGSIVILHDGGSRGERTRIILDIVLPELERRGLRAVTLSQLFDSRALPQ
jgi:peptidoglycan/xylan/chitin deacetylase (PgdA/CDA1 family)